MKKPTWMFRRNKDGEIESKLFPGDDLPTRHWVDDPARCKPDEETQDETPEEPVAEQQESETDEQAVEEETTEGEATEETQDETPEEPEQPKKATTRKRARKKSGQFQADDPATPDKNEAYED